MKEAKVSLIEELKVELNNLEKLKRKFNSLVGDYQYYKSTPGKSWEEKDSHYYVRMMMEQNVGPYEEGRFSLYYTTLMTRVRENRKERNEYIEKIKEQKRKIKNIHRKINKCQNQE